MDSLMSTALDGLSRNQHAIEVAANNVANVNTDGFRAQRPDASGNSTEPRNPQPADTVQLEAGEQQPSDVDLATEFVAIKQAQVGYDASAALVDVADETTGQLLDLVG